jgi:hypothetical protein
VICKISDRCPRGNHAKPRIESSELPQKRLETLSNAPESICEDVRTICAAAGSLEHCVADHLVLVRRRLEAWLESKGAL